MRIWPVFGAGIALLLAARRLAMGDDEMPLNVDWNGWLYPVPVWNGRTPVVSDYYSPVATEKRRKHVGVDIAFLRKANDPAGLPYSTPMFSSQNPPPPILAAFGGKVWSAGKTERGHHVLIDHGKVSGIGMCTFYQHLSRVDVSPGQVVSPGHVLGQMGGDLPPHYTWIHLHFELWVPVKGKPQNTWKRDPQPYLRQWRKVSLP